MRTNSRQPPLNIKNAVTITAVHNTRWARISSGVAGSRSGKNAGKNPHMMYAASVKIITA